MKKIQIEERMREPSLLIGTKMLSWDTRSFEWYEVYFDKKSKRIVCFLMTPNRIKESYELDDVEMYDYVEDGSDALLKLRKMSR